MRADQILIGASGIQGNAHESQREGTLVPVFKVNVSAIRKICLVPD
jgi:hypothetical protein